MKVWQWIIIAVLAAILLGGGVYLATQGNPIVKTKTITLTVMAQEGTFEVSAADAVQVKAGENAGFSVDVVPALGFNRPVKFTLSGGPAGMVVSWQAPGDTWTPGMSETNLVCELAVPLDNGLVGQYALTLTGTSQ